MATLNNLGPRVTNVSTTRPKAIGSTGLRKFTAIRSVGRFRQLAPSGDVELCTVNLIFGENGRGKTTLCAILRSLQSGDSDLILGRRTLGSAGEPAVQVLMHGAAPLTFENGAWSASLPELAIYDQTFISQNVYAGDAIGTDQKRNLFKVIVGQEAVRAAERLETVVREIRQAQAAIREGQTAVRSHLPADLKLEAFLAAEPDPDLEPRIAEADADVRAAQEADRLRTHEGLRPLVPPAAITGVEALLAESLDSVSRDTERLIREHMERHAMRGAAAGQAWIAQGLDFHPEAGCPFCGQAVDGLDLIPAYRALFSQEYQQLKERITVVGRHVADAFGEASRQALTQTLRDNRLALEFWRRFTEMPPVDDTPVAEISEIAGRYGEALLALLRQKVTAPLEAVALDEAARTAAVAYEALTGAVAAYNEACEAANRVAATRRASAHADDLPRLSARLATLQTLKRRHAAPLKPLCDNVLGLTAQKDRLEAERENLKAQLDTQAAKVATYRDAINRYLDLFNAGFEIARVEHNYVGGVNASFQVAINKVAVPMGDEKTPANRPSFRNTLSAGDRSTLALAFFLAQLNHDSGREGRIAVFDDPFSSQDSFRRNQTAIEVARVADRCAQVIVLSHDAHFLKRVQEKVHDHSVKILKLSPVGEDTQITELDLAALLQSELRAHIDALQTYYRSNEGSPSDLVQKIRPLLEGYCRSVCITLFAETDNLGAILTGIRSAGESHPLASVYNDISDLNDYTKRYHHADGHALPGVIDETELKGIAKRALRIVGALI